MMVSGAEVVFRYKEHIPVLQAFYSGAPVCHCHMLKAAERASVSRADGLSSILGVN